jgi:hypothetical protein
VAASNSSLPDFASHTFEVSEEGRRLKRAERPLSVALIIGLVGLIGGGVGIAVVGFFGIASVGVPPRQWPFFGMGAIMGATGLVLARPVQRAITNFCTAVSVDAAGVGITMRDGKRWRADWKNPELRLVLLDYRKNRHRPSRRYNSIPCHMLSPQFEAGLSVAALDSSTWQCSHIEESLESLTA